MSTTTPTTYHIAMLDRAGKTIAEETEAEERKARDRYRRAVSTFNNAGYDSDVHAVALVRVDDARRRSVLASTAPQTSRARGKRV